MDNSLLLLASEVRSKTLWLLEGLTDETARFTAPGLVNSILWHAGHVFVVVESLGVSPATGQPAALPDGWFEAFSWDSDPRTVTHWPPVAEVAAALRDQLPRLTAAIAALTPQQLDQMIGPPDNAPLRYLLVHGLHDEANHQGEMWLLRKMLKRAGNP
ncbi:MAG: DinB family protein [Pirellulaceae bacterium]|nr:DinB family protein [Pirellulaceae bacterium]